MLHNCLPSMMFIHRQCHGPHEGTQTEETHMRGVELRVCLNKFVEAVWTRRTQKFTDSESDPAEV